MTRIHAVVITMVLAAVLASCTTVTNPDRLKQTQTDDLCEMYYFANHPETYTTGEKWPGKKAAIKAELINRNAIAADQWPLVDDGKMQPGMGDCALKASWGNPLQTYHEITPDGEITKYVYGLNRKVELFNKKVKSVHY